MRALRHEQRTAPPTELEVSAAIKGCYPDRIILAQTQTHILLGVLENGGDISEAMIFVIDQKHFGSRIGYIGSEIVRLEKRDLDSGTFALVANNSFKSFQK